MLTRRSFALSAVASLVAAPALAKMMPVVATPSDYVPLTRLEQEKYKDFFNNSNSELGGCCGIGDGFMQGFTYRVWRFARELSGHYEDVVVLRSVQMRPDAYWVEVYDTNHGKHVWLPVPQQAFVRRPNPTGYYIVWIYYPESVCTIRCFAPLAQT